jgi:hypothetical protein
MKALEYGSCAFSESNRLQDCGYQISVKEFIFNDEFKGEIGIWPSDLKAIIMSKGINYNYMIEKLKINNDTRAVFDNFYNVKLRNLPSNLKIIYFGHFYNYPIDDLPDSIEYIELGFKFNLPIRKFPANLKYIKFDHNYSHDIILPSSGNIVVEVSSYYEGNIINRYFHKIKRHVID